MAEYIEREALDKKLTAAAVNDENKNCNTWSNAIGVLYNLPAADVAPVVHGTWELRHGSWYCSNCGRGYKIKFGVAPACKHNYCPNCGAKMDGDSDALD